MPVELAVYSQVFFLVRFFCLFVCFNHLITKCSARLDFSRIGCLKSQLLLQKRTTLKFVQLRSKIPRLIIRVQAQILMMSSPDKWLYVGRCFQVCDLLVERLLIKYEQQMCFFFSMTILGVSQEGHDDLVPIMRINISPSFLGCLYPDGIRLNI